MPTEDPNFIFYTPEEAAEILRLSVRTVYEYLRGGKLKCHILSDTARGKYRRVSKAAIQELLGIEPNLEMETAEVKGTAVSGPQSDGSG